VVFDELLRGRDRVARDAQRFGKGVDDRELGGGRRAVDQRHQQAAMDDALAKRLRDAARELFGIDPLDGVEVQVGPEDVVLHSRGEAPLQVVDLAVGGGDGPERAKAEARDLGRRGREVHAAIRTEPGFTRKQRQERVPAGVRFCCPGALFAEAKWSTWFRF
jgi:hypothetical protein